MEASLCMRISIMKKLQKLLLSCFEHFESLINAPAMQDSLDVVMKDSKSVAVNAILSCLGYIWSHGLAHCVPGLHSFS